MNPPLRTMWRWVLMLIILLCLVCLWVSWRADWFPFGASLLNQPTKQDTLNSLTATGTPSTTLNELTPALVKGTATGTSLFLSALSTGGTPGSGHHRQTPSTSGMREMSMHSIRIISCRTQ